MDTPRSGAARSGPALLFGTKIFPIHPGTLMIGRADPATAYRPNVDLEPFDIDHLVSRRHADLVCDGTEVSIEDLGSANGTFIDEERLPTETRCPLQNQQRVRFGHLTLVFAASVPWPGSDAETVATTPKVIELLGALPAARGARQEVPRAVIERLRSAMEAKQVTMVFQPIVKLMERHVVGVESLARITAEPQRGPDAWFADAFVVGLGIELELAAISLALAQLPGLPAGVYLGVNASPATVVSPRFSAILDDHPLERLVVEVTEHAAVFDYQTLLQALGPLRARGLRLAIDDMGSGYASMQHVLRLAPDVIKLDIALVRGIDRDPARRALAGSMVAFAEAIDASIVAEGIETPEELLVLEELGIPLGQGFYLARPGPIGSLSVSLPARDTL